MRRAHWWWRLSRRPSRVKSARSFPYFGEESVLDGIHDGQSVSSTPNWEVPLMRAALRRGPFDVAYDHHLAAAGATTHRFTDERVFQLRVNWSPIWLGPLER